LCDEVLVLDEGRVMIQSDPHTALAMYHDLMRQRTEKRGRQIRVSSPTSVLPVTLGNREGTQECSISAVRVYDEKGQLTESVETGSPLSVEIDIQRADHIPDMAYTVGIFSDSHVKCWEVAIPSLKTIDGAVKAKHSIRLEFPSLPLVPGRYFLNLGIYPPDWSYLYDRHWQMYPLNITGARTCGPGVYAQGILFLNISIRVTNPV
jgi:lipopolysaccharide transport system ATP-binding protein